MHGDMEGDRRGKVRGCRIHHLSGLLPPPPSVSLPRLPESDLLVSVIEGTVSIQTVFFLKVLLFPSPLHDGLIVNNDVGSLRQMSQC